MDRRISLTHSECHSVGFALGIAAERFEADMIECAAAYAFESRKPYLHAMACTFQSQAAEVRKLALRFQ